MTITLSGFQSILQIFVATYIAAEWISLEKIGAGYIKKYKKDFFDKMSKYKKYDKSLQEIDDKFSKNLRIYTFELEYRIEKVKKISHIYSIISIILLVVSTLYPNTEINRFLGFLMLLFLSLPILFGWYYIHRFAQRNYNNYKSFLLKKIEPIEQESIKFEADNPKPKFSANSTSNNYENLFFEYITELDAYEKKLDGYLHAKFSKD